MWKLEAWVRPVRADDGRVVTQGRWKLIESLDELDKTLEAVIAGAALMGVVKATKENAAAEEPRTIRAYAKRGWGLGTGSGGLLRE